MATLYFENRFEELIPIATNCSWDLQKALDKILEFCESKGYHSYYQRIWGNEEEGYHFDVGSHSEFFRLLPYKESEE